jgi:hypothetical protein
MGGVFCLRAQMEELYKDAKVVHRHSFSDFCYRAYPAPGSWPGGGIGNTQEWITETPM